MLPLTSRQADCLSFVRGFERRHGYTPSFREIAAGMGFKSTSNASRLLTLLEERGVLKRTPHRRRAIQIIEPCICPHCGGQVRQQTLGA